MQNLSIEEKIELIHRMKNIPVASGREMKTEGRRRILLPFFVRLIGSVILCGVIYYMIKENLVTKEVLLETFSSTKPINLIDFFLPIKYTFMR